MSKRFRNGSVDEFDQLEYRSHSRNRNGREKSRFVDEETPQVKNRNRARTARRGHQEY